MKAVGLVVEYNPFHNGHAFHLAAAKEQAQADVVIAVMSGHFLQRGEPALVSKWVRTRMALIGGVDIVIELPYIFAVQKAETFARGAVAILNAIGCSSLCFGSENGEIASFYHTLALLNGRREAYDEAVRAFMKTGVSYPKALSSSLELISQTTGIMDLSKPNNILGFHYIKALVEQKSAMKPLTIKRKSADFHDESFSSEGIASATSIRKALFAGKEKDTIVPYIPASTKELLEDYYQQFGFFHQWENYFPYLQFRLLQSNPKELRENYEVEEGIENRLIQAALETSNFQDFMKKIKTKRYTWTRLQRICLHILTNTKKEEINSLSTLPGYMRLLGMTENGKRFLNSRKSHFSLQLISKLSTYKGQDIAPDIRASRIYACALPNHLKGKYFNQEYNQPPIYLK